MGNGTGGTRGTDRRTFIRAVTTAAVGATGLGAASTSGAAFSGDDGDFTGPADFPRATTRGHFDISWYGEEYLTDGHTARDYDTVGTLPSGAKEVVIAVHGWLTSKDDAPDNFATVSASLARNGYDVPVVGFSYDADTGVENWWPATDIAERNGPKLAQFLVDYAEQNPASTLRLTAHSLGARVVLEAAKSLVSWGEESILASITLLGGAADNDSVALSGEYGDALESAVGQVDNFWKNGDDVLNWAYSLGEADAAVGADGCEGTPPSNYEDHNVDYVPDHFSYHEPGDGCMAAVVSEL